MNCLLKLETIFSLYEQHNCHLKKSKDKTKQKNISGTLGADQASSNVFNVVIASISVVFN